MSIISGTATIANGVTNNNVLAGDIFEFLQKDSTIKAGWVGSLNLGQATWKIGDAITVENSPIPIGVSIAANTDLLYVDAGRAGSRLSLTIFNGNAAPSIFVWYFLII